MAHHYAHFREEQLAQGGKTQSCNLPWPQLARIQAALVCSAGFIFTHINQNQNVLEARETEHRSEFGKVSTGAVPMKGCALR